MALKINLPGRWRFHLIFRGDWGMLVAAAAATSKAFLDPLPSFGCGRIDVFDSVVQCGSKAQTRAYWHHFGPKTLQSTNARLQRRLLAVVVPVLATATVAVLTPLVITGIAAVTATATMIMPEVVMAIMILVATIMAVPLVATMTVLYLTVVIVLATIILVVVSVMVATVLNSRLLNASVGWRFSFAFSLLGT